MSKSQRQEKWVSIIDWMREHSHPDPDTADMDEAREWYDKRFGRRRFAKRGHVILVSTPSRI